MDNRIKKRTTKSKRDSVIEQAFFMFSIGPVLVYEKPPNNFQAFDTWTYHWKYFDQPSVYGPFPTLVECNRHFRACLLASGRISEPFPDNLIVVDFVNKWRIL
jgi:hypothetical protein